MSTVTDSLYRPARRN